VIFFGLYAAATQLYRFLGRSGVEIVSRVFGLVLCSIAVNGLITAIKLSFGLATLASH
jgi:small neutral amino acid transporter SnatA (MarC family)